MEMPKCCFYSELEFYTPRGHKYTMLTTISNGKILSVKYLEISVAELDSYVSEVPMYAQS